MGQIRTATKDSTKVEYIGLEKNIVHFTGHHDQRLILTRPDGRQEHYVLRLTSRGLAANKIKNG